MAETAKPQNDFDTALGECLSHLRDTSVRDGQQSHDANKWSIDQVTAVLKEINTYAVLVKEITGAKIPPVEAIGGGCFLQNARFLGEDPFDNMAAMHAAAPDLVLQDLDRGRQLYAMVPNSTEAQEAIRGYMVERGLGSKRIFDMMNAPENQIPAIEQCVEIKNAQRAAGVPEDKLLKIEAAISYIGPNAEGERAISPERYGQMAVDLIKAGADCVVLKDYAGQARNSAESQLIAGAIHEALKQAYESKEISFMPVLNWHSHGHKPEVLKELIDSGKVNIVDTAFGDLSKGSSHTNMRELVKSMMSDRGFDIDSAEHQNHPVIQQISKIENTIGEISKVHKKFRASDIVTADQVYDSKIAGGAVAALWAMINRDWSKIGPMLKVEGDDSEKKKLLLNKTLERNQQVWDQAGQFNTVTPGATICYDKAIKDTINELSGKGETHILDHTQQYKDIVKGRWGTHIAMEEGNGDQGLRNAYLISDSVKILQNACRTNNDLQPVYADFMKDIGISEDKFNRGNKGLEAQLRGADIAQVSTAIDKIKDRIPAETYELMKYELSTKPYKAVSEGMDFAHARVEQLCETHHVEISETDKRHWANLILACRTNDKGFAVGENLFIQKVVNKNVGRVGEIESPRYGDLEDIIKGSDMYDKLIRFKATDKEVAGFFAEKGYDGSKQPSVVYNMDRVNDFIDNRLYKFAEKDVVANLISYIDKRINGQELGSGIPKLSALNMDNAKTLKTAAQDPEAAAWNALKRACSGHSDNLMNVALANKDLLTKEIATRKDVFTKKLKEYYGERLPDPNATSPEVDSKWAVRVSPAEVPSNGQSNVK